MSYPQRKTLSATVTRGTENEEHVISNPSTRTVEGRLHDQIIQVLVQGSFTYAKGYFEVAPTADVLINDALTVGGVTYRVLHIGGPRGLSGVVTHKTVYLE
jgi:hypothetical protein